MNFERFLVGNSTAPKHTGGMHVYVLIVKEAQNTKCEIMRSDLDDTSRYLNASKSFLHSILNIKDAINMITKVL